MVIVINIHNCLIVLVWVFLQELVLRQNLQVQYYWALFFPRVFGFI